MEQNIETRVRDLEMLINGPPEGFGMRSKVEIMWRLHVPSFLLIGAVIGALGTLLVTKLAG